MAVKKNCRSKGGVREEGVREGGAREQGAGRKEGSS